MVGTNELLIIALVVLVLFGAGAIPKFARSLGQAKKEFDKGTKESGDEKNEDKNEAAKPEGSKK
jgi:sec-independent protein translocase protein TatA